MNQTTGGAQSVEREHGRRKIRHGQRRGRLPIDWNGRLVCEAPAAEGVITFIPAERFNKLLLTQKRNPSISGFSAAAPRLTTQSNDCSSGRINRIGDCPCTGIDRCQVSSRFAEDWLNRPVRRSLGERGRDERSQ